MERIYIITRTSKPDDIWYFTTQEKAMRFAEVYLSIISWETMPGLVGFYKGYNPKRLETCTLDYDEVDYEQENPVKA